MLRRVISILRLGLVALWTGCWIVVALLVYVLTQRHSSPLWLARRIWAPGVLRFLGARLSVLGSERLDSVGACLFVANHSSQLDIPVVFAAVDGPLRFLAKEELRRVPLVGLFMQAMGMVFIDRQRSESARRSIDQVAQCLRAGMSLMAFPEGTRSPNGRIQPFKTGAFVAAIKAGVPVVPVLIRGANRVLPARSLLVFPGQVEVEFGEPVCSRGLTVEDRREHADRVHSRLVGMSQRQTQRVASSRT